MWTVPDGVTPEAQVYWGFSPLLLIILSAAISAQCTDFGFFSSLIAPDYTQRFLFTQHGYSFRFLFSSGKRGKQAVEYRT
jgi:hypothetical protein